MLEEKSDNAMVWWKGNMCYTLQMENQSQCQSYKSLDEDFGAFDRRRRQRRLGAQQSSEKQPGKSNIHSRVDEL